ncbi:hypothetical protein V5799_006053 [Amblyomma americanum]|uniref:Uncharacterized protein n=1 Tax=Amblyomma americanum TaxID=6943 RepID=A0AAQ4DXH6_AMBAM
MRPQSIQGFLVICLLVFVASRAEHSGEDHVEMEEDKIILGIYIVYDDAFTKGFLFNNGDKPFNDYFTALCNAAEAYFKDLRDPRVMLALAGTSRLEEKNIIQTTLKDRKTYVDGEKTLDKFYDIMTWNESLPEGIDVVFLVTGTETWITEEAVTNQWKGLAAPKSICFSAKTVQAKAVGIVYDDGKNFNGVPVLALQVAMLSDAAHERRGTDASADQSDSVETGSSRRRLALGMMYVSVAVLIIFVAELYLFASLSKRNWAKHHELQRNGTVDVTAPTTLRNEGRSGRRHARNASVTSASSSSSEDSIATPRFEADWTTSAEDIPQVSSANYSVHDSESLNNSDKRGNI